MNKKIVALAVAAAFAVPVAASAQTTLFGQFKYEVGYVDGGDGVFEGVGADRTLVGVENADNNLVHSYKGTRLGVRGSEDLGGGIKAIYRFQAGFSGVNSSMANNTFRLNEENWAGLQGGFGTLQLGRSDTAFKKAGGGQFRAFSDTLAEPSLQNENNSRAEGIHYTTPTLFGGFTGYLTLEPNGDGTDTYMAIGGAYKFGPFMVSAAYEDAPDTGVFTQNLEDESNYAVGGKWDFGQGDVGVLFQSVRDGDRDIILVPVNFKVTPNVNLRAALKYTDDDLLDEDWTNWGIGAQYMFSSRTEAFLNVWADDAINQTSAGANTSDDSTHFGFGLRHSF